jgi:hypothetical protein
MGLEDRTEELKIGVIKEENEYLSSLGKVGDEVTISLWRVVCEQLNNYVMLLCLSVSLSLSLCLSIYLSLCPYVFLVFLSFCLAVFLSFCLSVFLSFFLSVFLSFCLSVFLSFCLSVFLSFCLSAFLCSVLMCFCLSFSVFQSVSCLSVFLSFLFMSFSLYPAFLIFCLFVSLSKKYLIYVTIGRVLFSNPIAFADAVIRRTCFNLVIFCFT